MNNGTVTFSFDCEGKWGMTDIPTPWDVSLTRANLLQAYEFILETLHQYEIPATFAFVGAFTQNREQFLDETFSKLSSKSYSTWLDYSRERIINEAEEGWFMPELLDMVKEYNTHEIASHGFSHIPFDMLDKVDARTELSLVKDWAENNKIKCETLVYPRNAVAHPDLLKEYGILGYRDLPDVIFSDKLPKIFKTLFEEIWVYKKAQQLEASDPIKIPGGVFINWQYNFRQYIPTFVSLLKYKHIVKDAEQRNGVAHFWLHPHNLITSPSTKLLFEKLCAEIARRRDEYGLVVRRQKDYISE